MAASRQNAPLRAVADNFVLADGTMCRMPSPLPGPLRNEPERSWSEVTNFGGNAPGHLLEPAARQFTQSRSSSSSLSGLVLPDAEKVA